MNDRDCIAGARAQRFARAVAASVLILLGTTVARLARAQSPEVDPPGRAARLSEVEGPVWLIGADDDGWIAVDRNRPLTIGDRIAIDNGARAEISLGSTTPRLDPASELEIIQLDDAAWGVRLEPDARPVTGTVRPPRTARPAEVVPRGVLTQPAEEGRSTCSTDAHPAEAARGVDPRRSAAGPQEARPETRAPRDERSHRDERRDIAPDEKK